MITVAALYIDPRGPYPKMEGVDCWDEARDARKYVGPWPVVAHPPCRNYSKLRRMATGDDSDCALIALEQVRRFGGVLEHPATSRLWLMINLPSGHADDFGGRRITVNQVQWGHVARKRTSLYIVGGGLEEQPPFPNAQPTHWLSGFREHSRTKQTGAAVPPGIKVCSAQQRRRTPPLFAEYLVRLARSAAKERAA